MDQDKDTINRAKNSREGRHWLADDVSAVPQAEVPQPETAIDMPPTLFELPDRTPEALRKPKESPQFMLDDAHSGPPASHVNRPPGDFSEIEAPSDPPASSPGSTAPLVQQPPSDVGSSESRPVRIDPVRIDSQLDAVPDLEHRIAAFHDESQNADFRANPAWGVRSAITLLVLAMVTLAYFSGRQSRPGETENDRERVATATGDEILIDIAADLETDRELGADPEAANFSSDPISTKALASQTLATGDILMEIENLPSTDSADPMVDTVPSYVAEVQAGEVLAQEATFDFNANASVGSNAESTVSSIDSGLGQPLPSSGSALDDGFSADFPEPPDTRDATVAYRADAAGEDLPEPADDLPAGMDDRLRLEDGLRYTGTPYPIGNFLEILRNWEASEQQ